MTLRRMLVAAVLSFASIAAGCATTGRQQHATCLAAHYDYGGASPCGYDQGSQAQEPSGP